MCALRRLTVKPKTDTGKGLGTVEGCGARRSRRNVSSIKRLWLKRERKSDWGNLQVTHERTKNIAHKKWQTQGGRECNVVGFSLIFPLWPSGEWILRIGMEMSAAEATCRLHSGLNCIWYKKLKVASVRNKKYAICSICAWFLIVCTVKCSWLKLGLVFFEFKH